MRHHGASALKLRHRTQSPAVSRDNVERAILAELARRGHPAIQATHHQQCRIPLCP